MIVALILVGAIERDGLITVVPPTVTMVSVTSVRWPIVVSSAPTTSALVISPTWPVVAVRIVACGLRFHVQTNVLVGHVLHFHHRGGDARVVENDETEILLMVTSRRVDFGIGDPAELREALDQRLPSELRWQRTNEHLLLVRWRRGTVVGSVLLLSVVRPLLRTGVLLRELVAAGTSGRIARSTWIRWWR